MLAPGGGIIAGAPDIPVEDRCTLVHQCRTFRLVVVAPADLPCLDDESGEGHVGARLSVTSEQCRTTRRPRVTFVTADLPWQAASGASLRDLAVLRALRKSADVHLLAFPIWNIPQPGDDLRDAVVHPAPWPRGALERVRLRIAATRRGRQVFQEHLARHGALERLADDLRREPADVVVLGHPLYDGFVEVARPLAPRLIVDLWELRVRGALERMRTGVDSGRRLRAAADLLVLQRIERGVARLADEVWLVEPRDAARYARRYGVATRVLPTTIDVASYARHHTARREPETFGFVGILYYDPNITAVTRLMSRILPIVRRRRPEARSVVIGRSPLDAVRAAVAAAPGAVLRADVPDAVEELVGAGMLVAPLDTGTGMRVKFLEAAAARVPIVTNRRGLEGLTFVPGTEVLLAESDGEFADAIIRIWDDPSLRECLVTAAHARVVRDYDSSSTDRRVAEAVTGRIDA